MLYATTDKFLRVFGINSLSELPETEMMPMNIDETGEVNTAQMVMQIPNSEVLAEIEREEDPSPDIPVSAAPLTETVIND
jgi:hypothetical protein